MVPHGSGYPNVVREHRQTSEQLVADDLRCEHVTVDVHDAVAGRVADTTG